MTKTCLACAGGEFYFDQTCAFNKAVHGGSIRKGSLAALLNPFGEAWKNAKRAKASGLVKDSNMNGDGLTMGGECLRWCMQVPA